MKTLAINEHFLQGRLWFIRCSSFGYCVGDNSQRALVQAGSNEDVYSKKIDTL